MSSITLKRSQFISGVGYSAGQVITTLAFAVAGSFVAGGQAYWTLAPLALPLPDKKGETFLEDVTAATGGVSTSVDGYTTAHIPTGRVFACIIAAKRCVYQLQAAGVLVADGDGIIEPPDFDAVGNNRFLVQIQ